MYPFCFRRASRLTKSRLAGRFSKERVGESGGRGSPKVGRQRNHNFRAENAYRPDHFFNDSLNENAFSTGAEQQILFPLGKLYKGEMKGDAYVTHFVRVNYYFNMTTAYSILRHCGVDIGKTSFLCNFP
jgi:hypothetical protein